MELKHLRAFHAVADLLHFRKAAQRLGVTQPALSQQISRLEAEVGVRLFDRDRRRVLLTREGEALRADTREALAQLDRAVAACRAAGERREKTLRVGQLQYISHAFLPSALRSLKRALPDVLVELVELPPAEAVSAVRDGAVDVGFGLSPLTRADDLVTREVVRGHWAVWLPADHPLARREHVPLELLVKEPLLMFERGLNPQTYDFMLRLFRSHGHHVRVALHVAQPQHGIPLVLQGLGLFVVGSYVIEDAPRGAVRRPLSGFPNDLRITAVWRPDGRLKLLRPFLAGLPRLRG
ncbi:MAG: LysR family transcriptional regulator [Myxococcota bacterium]